MSVLDFDAMLASIGPRADWNLEEISPLTGSLPALETCSLRALGETIRSWDPDAVVSALSPWLPVRLLASIPHLHLGFSDVIQPRLGCVLMRPKQMELFLQFLDRVGPCRLLIHCSRGISRSPALAVVAAQWWNIAYTPRPDARPNPYVLALGGELSKQGDG